ncbi:MAG: hypothetical protein MUC65_01090 [Pontiellaceae bacterium]|nr:hypothetical protein [Pontiellaceae bacterium]
MKHFLRDHAELDVAVVGRTFAPHLLTELGNRSDRGTLTAGRQAAFRCGSEASTEPYVAARVIGA